MKLKNLVRMPADAAYLRSYSARGEAHAEAVVCAITSNDDGFWQIACEIHERYPDNSSLKAKLGSAIGGFGSGFFDVSAEHSASVAATINRVRGGLDERFPRTRMWFGELANTYSRAAQRLCDGKKATDISTNSQSWQRVNLAFDRPEAAVRCWFAPTMS